MVIKKLGHCCMVVEEGGLRILTDPGAYSTLQSEEKNVDVILITHEHTDHCHIESVQRVLKNNPQAKIITNKSVATLLAKDGHVESRILEDGQKTAEKGVAIEGVGNIHAEIYQSLPRVQNTGYFVAGKLFYPGDAFTNPMRPVETLAVPIAGPWMRMSEGIDYVKALKPRVCFPVHDGGLKYPEVVHRTAKLILEPFGVSFRVLEVGKAEKL